jgi:phosphonate transport system substrate-binding protein
MHRTLPSLLISLLLLVTTPASVLAAEGGSLVMGIFPYLNAHKLYRIYLPVKHHLEQVLSRPVILVTAPDYRSFLERTAAGDYDLVVTAPHFALLSEQESGFRRVGKALPRLQGALIVRRDQDIEWISDLKGRAVAMPDELAIITFLGEELMQQHDLNTEEDVEIQNVAGINRPLLLVSRGQVDAAVTVAGVINSMPVYVQDSLKVLDLTRDVPHIMFMASPDLDEASFQLIYDSLLEFHESGAGGRFFRDSQLGGLEPILDEDMQALEDFVVLLQLRRQ